MSVPYAKVIVNPVAGARAGQRKWPRIKWLLQEAGLCFDYEFTQGALHGIGLAKMAVAQGYKLVVVVGGDGTINEVVNGLIGPSGKSEVDLGIISIGTANDFAHSLCLPKGLNQACHLLTSPRRVEVDIGAVEYVCQGEVRQRLFINVAGSGFDAALMQAVKMPIKPPGTKLPYAIAFLRTLATYSPKHFLVSLDGKKEARHALTVLVSNSRYAGTIPFTPDADLSDGQFEVIAVEILEMLKALPRMYFKVPNAFPIIDYKRSSFVQLESPQRLPVEADGEVLGELPASFWVLPKALRVVA